MRVMAGASDKINSLIAQEFSFVQELVWLPPRRNPFPQCTDKIVSDFRRLEVLFRRPAHVPARAVTGGRNNLTHSRRSADHALSILTADADHLIKLRHSLCKQLNSMQTSPSLNDFENQAEVLIMQHLENAWGSCKHGSVEAWASKVKGLDFQALDAALQHRFDSFFSHAIDYSKEHGDDKCNLGGQGCNSNESQIVNDAISQLDDEEYDDDEVSEVDSDEGGTDSHNQRLPLVLLSNNEVGHESKPNVWSTNNRLASCVTVLHLFQGHSFNFLRKNAHGCVHVPSRRDLPAQIEMTMKARICTDHITAPEENCWHIIFGLVNHDHSEIAVHSLSYWSLDNESEVSTIKWPKGGVILKESPSFLCYSCQVCCTGPADSPRVAFSWQYRSLQKYPAPLRGGSNEALKDRAIGPPSLELQDTGVGGMKEAVKDPLYITDSRYTAVANVDVPAPSQTPCQGSSNPFYKRLGHFLPWKDSRKKAKMCTA